MALVDTGTLYTKTFPNSNQRKPRVGLVAYDPETLEAHQAAAEDCAVEVAFGIDDPTNLAEALGAIDAQLRPDAILFVSEPGQKAVDIAKVPALAHEVLGDVRVVMVGRAKCAQTEVQDPDYEAAAGQFSDVLIPNGFNREADARFAVLATQRVVNSGQANQFN